MIYSKNWAYRVEMGGFAYRLNQKYTITEDHHCRYFSLMKDGHLLIRESFNWDGATKFFDFKWILTPSAIHDALHQAIQYGWIPESENNLIDKELEQAICGNVGKKWLLKIRGLYVRKATNWVDQKIGEDSYVELPTLENEMRISDYENAKRFNPVVTH